MTDPVWMVTLSQRRDGDGEWYEGSVESETLEGALLAARTALLEDGETADTITIQLAPGWVMHDGKLIRRSEVKPGG